MARPYRLQGEDCFYHITSRGDDRKRIFFGSADYDRFLEYLLGAKEKFRYYCYAYCLMTNHYHLLIETTLPNISRIMQYINSSYTAYYNTRHRRCGHVFQGRFKSIVVEKDSYFKELSRYIHLNPVRAKIVKEPADYPWSSYRGYLGKSDKYLDIEEISHHLDLNRRQYQQFVLEGIGRVVNPFRDVYAGFLLGSAKFIKAQLESLKEEAMGDEVAHRGRLRSDTISAYEIMAAVARRYRRSIAELRGDRNRPMIPRQVAIYLLRRHTDLTNSEIGREFGLSFSAVSKARENIERLMRRDPTLQREVERILSSFKV